MAPQSVEVIKFTTSSITIAWKEPENDGGAPVTSYLIDIKEENASEFKNLRKLDGDVYSYTCLKLKPDTAYDFQVFAENSAGISKPPATLTGSARTKAKSSEFSF